MGFRLEKLLVDVFSPRSSDVVTIMYDIPMGKILDNDEWRERREMADTWHQDIIRFSNRYGFKVKSIVTYEATGADNSDMPDYGICESKRVKLEDIIRDSTIIISMPEYSASAPLMWFAKKYKKVRVASMPGVSRSMEETALSADYQKVAESCAQLAPLFEKAIGIEVVFSTGHRCYFDISDNCPVFQDDGLLHPNLGQGEDRIKNLPSGEVCTCPNEAPDSRTIGEIPATFGSETIVFVVKNNKIIDVKGNSSVAREKQLEFKKEPALGNIAEVAIGCNNKAVVTGNVLEDEKAGFHWAYGRSDHLGGRVGVKDFSSPDKVIHQDIVYAKGNPIVCEKLDFVFQDGTIKTAIVDGVLKFY